MIKFNPSMFDSIKESLLKKSTSSSFQDFLKLEIGKTYLVRLLPNVENLDRSFYHYFNHIWKSLSTNELVSVLCPSTYGERCPIDEYRFKVYRSGTDSEKEQSKLLRRNENWLVNVYVISDPTNPENEGKVKTLRYGKQLNKIIRDALDGDDAEHFGSKVYDLTSAGCTFRIKVEENEGGYASYTSSRFLPASAVPGLDTEEKINAIYDGVKDLDSVFEHKTYDQIQQLIDVHYFGKSVSTPSAPVEKTQSEININKPEHTHSVESISVTTSSITDSTDSDESEEERKMREILAGL
jgi:hypothetical protein